MVDHRGPEGVHGSAPRESGAGARRRRWLSLGAVLLVASLQLGMTWGWRGVPFYDGAAHYNFDNAMFTYLARNGIRLGTPRAQLGLTEIRHSAWGVPVGEPWFYAHHPFLMKTLFQAFVRLLGDAEWVSRVFALGISFVAAAGVLASLRIASGSLAAALLGAAVLVSVPVFAQYQACLKFELDGMALATWFFVATASFLGRGGAGSTAAVGALAALATLAHWTGLLFVGVTVAWLGAESLRETGRRACARAALAAAAGAGAGLAVLVAAFAWLSGGLGPWVADIGERMLLRADASALPPGAWAARQLDYVGLNFGGLLPWLAAALSVGLVAEWVRRRRARGGRGPEGRLLPAFVSISLVTAGVWQFGFRQGSYIHDYWQLWFSVPVAGLVAAAVVAFSRHGRAPAAIAVLAAAGLATHLYRGSHAAYGALVRGQIGDDAQLEFLVSLRDEEFTRFVFVPTGGSPLNAFFDGPSFDYYTDRPLAAFGGAGQLRAGDKVLLLRHEVQEEVVAAVGARVGGALAGERCGPGFCAYDFVPAPPRPP